MQSASSAAAAATTATTRLLPSRRGNLGLLTLNNPARLHALTYDMMRCFEDVLTQWYKDDSLKAIIVKSSSPEPTTAAADDDDSSDKKKKPPTKAFCAGGDVKQVYLSGLKPPPGGGEHGQGRPGLDTADFFRQEYRVNYLMATARKPQVSLWDGIVMGGGAGVSVHGKYRVATENAVFAMPETGIGLFPDVGSMYWMPRLLSQGQAVYLALTGARLKPEDLLYSGLATHYVPSSKLDELEDALVEACYGGGGSSTSGDGGGGVESVAPVLMRFHEDPPVDPLNSKLAQHRGTIRQIFGVLKDSELRDVEDIVKALRDVVENEEGDCDFARQTLETLLRMSPTSLKVSMEGLRRGSASGASVGDCLKMEFRMSQGCMRTGSDFYEGIRAVLVDKDNDPKWNPSQLADVTEEMVQSYFDPIEYEWEEPDFAASDNKSSKL